MSKFVFVSNYLNHHQIPFCGAMYGLLSGSFVFIQTEPMEQERVRMGWQEQTDVPYLRKYYEEPESCRELIDHAKVVFFGGSDEESYIEDRLRAGRPVIRYSERLYKTGQWKAVSPRGLKKKYHDHTCYRNRPVYLCCAGAYVPSDFHLVGAYPGKMLKWGYFPEKREYDINWLMEKKQPGRILWAARFLDWKHPELPIRTAAYLKEKGYSFHLDVVGGGEMEKQVSALVESLKLQEVVTLHGYCPPEQVRGMMERADIYLTTSDRQEGWGAVVNEAMNSGCAVVGSSMMGAVPYLIRHGENGMIYRDGSEDSLLRLTERLLQDRELCQRLGRSAVRTIVREWNAETAAERLLGFCVRQDFLEEGDVPETMDWKTQPESGPVSRAPVIPERKMYSAVMKGVL
ncbi:MAG: glycosyltransferase [Lachnospiraceae bacterium]|nr:glycosyltransferase [Lachnospiraceae bacterium]MCM1237879.1 glycosyltransferase [Lachnospiraceae bacterium]